MKEMTSNQPYLLRAFYDWIVDNGLTPYVVVSTKWAEVEVPTQFVKDEQIVLNISPSACINLSMDYESVSFQARFSGQPMQVFFPCAAVAAIYAKENGAGTVFTIEPPEAEQSKQELKKDDASAKEPVKSSKANLRVIK